MSQTISNAVVAIYIDSKGEIVATERIEGSRSIGVNQLDDHPPPSDATEIISVDVRVGYSVIAEGGARCYNYVKRRVCYDRFGNRIPCIG